MSPKALLSCALAGLALAALLASSALAEVQDGQDYIFDVMDAVQARDVAVIEPSVRGAPFASLPWEQMVSRIQAVKGTPLGLTIGRLMGQMGMEVEPEEAGLPQAMMVAPTSDPRWDTWRKYLDGTVQTEGTKDLQATLSLRRDARILKLKLYLEAKTGRSITQLTDAEVAPLRENDPNYGWLAADIFEPLTLVFADPEDAPQTGPAHAPLPMLNLLPAEQVPGAESVHGVAAQPDGGPLLAMRSDSVMFLQDIEGVLDIDKGIVEDTIGDVLVHELFHGIQSDMTGLHPLTRPSKSMKGHDAHMVTDRYLAFAEGWAEMSEAWFGEDNAAFDNQGGASAMNPFLLARQKPIRHNLYAQENFQKYVVTKSGRRLARIKNGAQMEAAEGLVAHVLYALMTHEKIERPFELALTTMYEVNPLSLSHFVTEMAKRAKSETERKSILLTHAHATRFATVSAEARVKYQAYYAARLGWLAAKNAEADEATVAAARDQLEQAKAAYGKITQDLSARLLSGALALDAAVGPEMWIEGLLDGMQPFRFDLNTIEPGEMLQLGFSRDAVRNLLRVRDAQGPLESIDVLRISFSDQDYAMLAEMREAGRQGMLDGMMGMQAMMGAMFNRRGARGAMVALD